MQFLHLIGSAMIVVLISFIIVDLLDKEKKLTIKGLLGSLVSIVLLFFVLLRT